MTLSASCLDVSKKVAIGGGIDAAISAICSSEITPGPLGMAETKPTALAPQSIASRASSRLEMQQILTRGGLVAFMSRVCVFWPSLASRIAIAFVMSQG